MCKSNRGDCNDKCGTAKYAGPVKDWVLFFGELVKASVDGVVEFWRPDEKTAPESDAPIAADFEEILEGSDGADEADLCDECCEEDEAEAVAEPDSKELKRQAKLMKQAAKQAKKQERAADKAEKKAAKLVKKQAKQEISDAKKLEKDEKRETEKQEKAQKKMGYVPKNVILSETEKKFFDGIRSAVGLRYVVKPRVELADVLKRGDGTKCEDEQLGVMDFGVFDLQQRLKVLIEVKGMKRRGKQNKKAYKKTRKLCKKAGIPVVTFWAKYGVLTDYIRERMQDYLNLK